MFEEKRKLALLVVPALALVGTVLASSGALAGVAAGAYALGYATAGQVGVAAAGLAGATTAAQGAHMLGWVGAGVVGGVMLLSGVGGM